ncbi:hypothetical protein EDD11_008212 [Mortierella claussenii]|nr:hypothetical protein EDD11_008212 [Mortierella claussenii]
MATVKQQAQHTRHNLASSPPSPRLLTRANSDFYSAPIFEEPKKKSTSLLPSPTTLEAKPLPDEPRDGRNGSNPTSPIITSGKKPTVALTMATPVHPHPPRLSLNLLRSDDDDDDEFVLAQDTAFTEGYRPYKVNTANIPIRTASSNLTESEQRGMAILKQRLSTEGFSASREGSPIPAMTPSEESTRAFINRIDELNTLTNSLQINLNDALEQQHNVKTDHDRLLKAYEELTRQNQELQSKMAKRDRDYEIMSKNYLDHVRMIRATDDDHSTIIERLTHLKAAIEHLIRKTQGSRSMNLNRAAAVEHFRNSGLLEEFPIPESALEPFHLNLYMESVFMSALVTSFFDKPLCCIFDYNKGFKEIYDWMFKRNNKLAVRWRQQLCVMLTQDPETKARQETAVTATANALTEVISKVYINSNEGPKIRELCSKAFDLAVAMTGLESPVSPVTVPLGTPFDSESMATSLKSNTEGIVALVIFPAFRDNDGFSVWPKVWCY